MKLAYSTNAFKKYSIYETIQMIADAGYDGIEILADVPHCYPEVITDKELNKLEGALDENGLEVSNLNTFTLFAIGDMHHPSWIEKEENKRKQRLHHTILSLQLAKELKCNNISIQPGGKLEDISKDKALGYFVEGLEDAVKEAEKCGVKILIEPEPNLFLENSKEFKWFIEHYSNEMIGLNCDVGHFYCANEEPEDVILALHNYIGHFHLEDIAETREHNHLIPGLGAINFEIIFQTIKKINYEGFASVELYPYQDNPYEAGKQAISFLKPIMEKILNKPTLNEFVI